jgi:hypothetical protein
LWLISLRGILLNTSCKQHHEYIGINLDHQWLFFPVILFDWIQSYERNITIIQAERKLQDISLLFKKSLCLQSKSISYWPLP